MIELNSKTQQDFLNREWVQKLLDAGVDMSDAKYFICSLTIGSPVKSGENIQVALKEELPWVKDMPGHLPALQYNWACPTYTVSELLYKLHEWMFPNKEEENSIESLASLLIQCHSKNIGIATKDTGDISGK